MEIKIGNNRVHHDIWVVDDVIRIATSRDKVIKQRVVDGFQDRKWKGGSPPAWRRESMYYEAPLNQRNQWFLDYLTGKPVYAKYTAPLVPFGLQPRFSKLKNKFFDPMPQQETMASHVWTRQLCHIAAEMRTGKTLPVLSVIERLGCKAWYIAPKSALAGVELELENWGFDLDINLMTYEKFTSVMETLAHKLKPPRFIVFDESHYIKNAERKRSDAAQHIADAIRDEYGDDAFVVAMTGTPSPKDPSDVWKQIEVVRPGFLAETSSKELYEKVFKIEYKDNETGGRYPTKLFRRDSENICDECGGLRDGHDNWHHPFTPAKNELKSLGARLNGVSIKFLKRDCMSLPEKIHDIVELKPSRTTLKYANQIKNSGAGAAQILIELAELSAGFYYKWVPDESKYVPCPRCYASGLVENVDGDIVDTCPKCNGKKHVHPEKRIAEQIECPKDELLIDLLEEAEPSARFVVFGGFTGCIDRVEELYQRQGWATIRIDGRGWKHSFSSNAEALKMFANVDAYPDKLGIIAHPATGGTGVSYSASSTIFYWHNPFDGAARMQSIERGTDMGMDMTKGCRIVDAVHLPVDRYILDNLNNKEKMQKIIVDEL